MKKIDELGREVREKAKKNLKEVWKKVEKILKTVGDKVENSTRGD